MSSGIRLAVDTMYYTDEYFSIPHGIFSLTTIANDFQVNDIVVYSLPEIAVIRYVLGYVVFNGVHDSSGLSNFLVGAQNMAIKKSSGSWGVDNVDFIKLGSSVLRVSHDELSGITIWGSEDVSSEVDGNATYNVRWIDAKVEANYLDISGTVVGLRIYWSVTG